MSPEVREMHEPELMFALEEEIGNPDLFIGRRKELDYWLEWVELARGKLADSRVLLARKRDGKTALVQRLYNILYSRNDPRPKARSQP